VIAFAALTLATTLTLAASTKPAEQTGANLFREKGCEYCHGTGGIGAKKGPPLTGDFRKTWTPEKIKSQLIMGGKKMPSFSDALSDDEIANLIAYLHAKHRPAPTVPQPPPPTAPAPDPQQ
jgi:ubiquinol-cytochrome c reductase cytochrome b subunit